MKQFLSFVKKEFIHISRDTRTMMILLAMPVVQIILFGFAISTEVKNVRVAVLDPSKDVVTQRIIERIDNSEYFNIVEYIEHDNQIEELFRDGDITLVVIFEDKFDQNLLHTGSSGIQLLADGTDPNQARSIVQYAQGVIMDTQMEFMAESGGAPMRIEVDGHMLFNPQLRSAFNFVPGVMGLIIMLICAMMTSVSVVREKEMGSMELLLASPTKPLTIIISKAVPYFVLSLVNYATILLLAVYVLDVPIRGSLISLTVVSMIFILVALSIGILLSSIAKDQMTATLLSGMGLMMPVMVLSGMIFPIESMPAVLRWISSVIPARWYISAVRKMMIGGMGFGAVIQEVTILTGMAIVLITASIKLFKNRIG